MGKEFLMGENYSLVKFSGEKRGVGGVQTRLVIFNPLNKSANESIGLQLHHFMKTPT